MLQSTTSSPGLPRRCVASLVNHFHTVKTVFTFKVRPLRNFGRAVIWSSMLASLSSLLEAGILIGLVALAADTPSPFGLDSTIVVASLILVRLAAAFGGAFVTAKDSKNVREELSLTTLENFRHLPWLARTALDPSDIRMMTLVLPQEISNARHGLATSFAAVTSSAVLAVIAFVMSPDLIVPLLAGIPLIFLSTIRRGRKSLRLASEANATRFDLGSYNEILPFGFEELRPSSRLSAYTEEYTSLVKREAERVFQLKLIQARGPIGLTTSIYFIFLVVINMFTRIGDAENLASLLVLMRVLLNLQAVLVLPGHISDYLVLTSKFETKLQVMDDARHRGSHRYATDSGNFLSTTNEEIPNGNLVELVDVFVKYSDQSEVGPVTMSVPPSGITLLWGPSGSGKTTIGRVLIGDLLPSSGSIIRSKSFNEDLIRVVPQAPVVVDDSFAENILFWLPGDHSNEIKNLISHLGLEGRIDDPISGLSEAKVGLSRVSGGERLRVGLGRAILGMNEGLLVVDEPTAALDAISRRLVMDLLQSLSQDISIVVISHDDDFKRISDQVVELSNDN